MIVSVVFATAIFSVPPRYSLTGPVAHGAGESAYADLFRFYRLPVEEATSFELKVEKRLEIFRGEQKILERKVVRLLARLENSRESARIQGALKMFLGDMLGEIDDEDMRDSKDGETELRSARKLFFQQGGMGVPPPRSRHGNFSSRPTIG